MQRSRIEPTLSPADCALEAEYALDELGANALIVHGAVGGKFLTDPAYDELLSVAEQKQAAIYLHLSPPPEAVIERYYAPNLSAPVSSVLEKYGFGWHVDSGVHLLNMILGGVFDRHPGLQVIMGHWGELLPFYVDRFDATLPADLTGCEHDPSYYLRNNMYVTPSGIFTPELLECCKSLLGADRIIFSIDYPLCTSDGKEMVLEHPGLAPDEKELIWHGNAERLLKLQA